MSITKLLNTNHVRWMDAEGVLESDIVISSRVRLARNLDKVPFPHLLNNESGQESLKAIKEAWEKSNYEGLKQLDLLTFDQIGDLDRQILVEKHLISPNHAGSSDGFRGLMVNCSGSMAIMINEEDHLRIQCLLPGLQLEECFKEVIKLDDAFEETLDFAFDDRRGYLTSCPTNVGTGMRASMMLHLPALSISGQAAYIFQNISQLGMTVRGLYGEGTEAQGNFFQLSNQVTLGQTEEDINSNLIAITEQIVEQERLLRTKLISEMKYQLEDRVGRAYGILTNARLITSKEALALLSDVRLGADAGIIKNIKIEGLNELVVAIRPAHLQKKVGREMDATQRDVERAAVIKEKLLASQGING
ncbi:MAG: protein arginine kinase [Syntrophomonadaceae bacterium]|nr:protein arginine kinase [Syntrophomonadaceae bacterium]MDD3022709.1 protein arginine kinase [Syntrophomonadaceae bacterium]